MTECNSPQYAAVEQPFGTELVFIHCPICGEPGLKIIDGAGQVTPCDHLAFIFVESVGEFEYQSEDFQSRLEKLELEEVSTNNFQEILAQAGYDNKFLAIALASGGMACGPVWETVVFGFDFNSLANKKQT